MKISAKGRYGIAAMANLAANYAAGTPITIISISEKLGISKIYLEQVFSLLKRAQLVISIKGSQGGYQLAKAPRDISAYDILSAIELSLMEKTASSTTGKTPALEQALQSVVYDPLNLSIQKSLQAVSLKNLLNEAERQKSAESLMYFI